MLSLAFILNDFLIKISSDSSDSFLVLGSQKLLEFVTTNLIANSLNTNY